MKRAAGTLLYRATRDSWEVLLVHASGNYNRNKPWSIPKGIPDPGEESMEAVARRETFEETGIEANELEYLGEMTYEKSRKTIDCYLGPAPANADPYPASWEVDRAEFVELDRAYELLHPDQCVFLDLLRDRLDRDRTE